MPIHVTHTSCFRVHHTRMVLDCRLVPGELRHHSWFSSPRAGNILAIPLIWATSITKPRLSSTWRGWAARYAEGSLASKVSGAEAPTWNLFSGQAALLRRKLRSAGPIGHKGSHTVTQKGAQIPTRTPMNNNAASRLPILANTDR